MPEHHTLQTPGLFRRRKCAIRKPIKDRNGFLAVEGAILFFVISVAYEIPLDVLFAAIEPRTKILHEGVKWIAFTDAAKVAADTGACIPM